MPVSRRTREEQAASPMEEFILLVDGVAYRARRYAQVAIGGHLVCGYAVRKEDSNIPHLVTASECSCGDHKWRGNVCKHMRAVRQLEEALRKLGGKDAATIKRDCQQTLEGGQHYAEGE